MNVSSFKKKYIQKTQGKSLGGTHPLNELACDAFKILKKAPSKYVCSLFVLSKLFEDIANNQERRMVEEKETKQLYNRLNKHIIKILENLEKNRKQDILSRDVSNLIKNYPFC